MATKITLALTIVIATVLLIPPLALWVRGGHPPHVRTLIELSQLTTAVERYKARYGQLFPRSGHDALVEHLRRTYPYATEIESTFSSSGRDLSRLDDAESLVLFLSGNDEELLGRNAYLVHEFEETRLADTDSDGWPECRTNDGEIYRYSGVLPFVYLKALRLRPVKPKLEPTGLDGR